MIPLHYDNNKVDAGCNMTFTPEIKIARRWQIRQLRGGLSAGDSVIWQ